MQHPPYEPDETVDGGELSFTDDGLETPERYVGFDGTLVVVTPDLRSRVTPIDAVSEHTPLLQSYPVAAEWFQEPYCDDDTVLIHPEGEMTIHRYRVVDERHESGARSQSESTRQQTQTATLR
ncbi:hypothetical protein [Natronorubrum daqingense]|uniref:Uncharacterized protein n=1 Tax=Natronorubrum daqingense TaxID=588898 RepID=A0A1N7CYB8_9EURY|nr:hypothetical protein [Natronorubrum daqingense]SIR68602.1 hypothetical protein SAMN05421809_1947 [Natronorubrum daqingense]